MGSNLRILHDHLGLALALAASSEAPGFPATHLETGDRHRFWTATSTGDQTLTYDAGSGNTKSCDAVVLPRADLLVAVGAHVAVQYSTDMAAWSDAVTPLTPMQAGDLSQPTGTDYVQEFTSQAKRGWRIKLYGTPSDVVRLAGGLFLGPRTELPKNPLYGRSLSVSRPHRGLEVELAWGNLTEAQAQAVLAALAAITPDAAEAPIETVAGVVYGGLPHYLYDPTGYVFRTSGTPYLLPALCLTPEAASTSVRAFGVETGPVSVRWRERR